MICPDALTNCITCSDRDTCTACEVNYHVSEGACVMDCEVPNCAACGVDPLSCNICETGFFVDGKLCVNCATELPNCAQCSDAVTCTLCDIDYNE